MRREKTEPKLEAYLKKKKLKSINKFEILD